MSVPPRSAVPPWLWILLRRIDALSEWVGRGVSWASLLMVLITFLVVVLRYAFDLGWIAMQESVTYLHAALFMLGAAFTLKHNAHVRVDILYTRWSERRKGLVDLLGGLFLLLPTCAFILWTSWSYVTESWAIREASREAGGIPGVFLLKTLILLMALLLILQGTVSLVRGALVLAGVGPCDSDEEDSGR